MCQQLPQYKDVIPSFTPRARAKDFYDVYLILQMHPFNPASAENLELLKGIFTAKRVPLTYIQEIKNNRFLHKEDWVSVKDTVYDKAELQEFDFYFDFVVDTFENVIIP